jgi:NADH:ubiquinone oxidoreductase subunit F (NADH-binding)
LLQYRGSVESLAEYRQAGGYISRSCEDLIDVIAAAGLRGRGGAAFPLAVKLDSVRGRRAQPVVIANGEEGEPASAKDRWLLRIRPHLVLDGLRRVAQAVGARRAIVYTSDPGATASVAAAIEELGERADGIEQVMVRPAYVAGEETSAVRAVNGGPALPLDKPPRPFEAGVDGGPTLVSNVETLANVPWIARYGAEAFRAVGSEGSPGTFLMTLSGACHRPGLYELPLGVPLGHAIDACGGTAGPPRGVLVGGFFAGVLGVRALDVPLDYDALRGLDSGLGCGAITVIGADDCPVAVAAEVAAYLARESAQQCGPCIRGTAEMSGVLSDLCRGVATREQVERLQAWSTSLSGRGACGLLDGAARVAGSLIREFPDEVDAHIGTNCLGGCAITLHRPLDGTRFRVDINQMTEGPFRRADSISVADPSDNF